LLQLVEPETVLETEHLHLEPLGEHHAALLHPVLQDARIYTYIPQEPPTFEWLRERYRRLAGRLSPAGDEVWLNWAVRVKVSGAYVGTVQATLTARGTAEIAYELGPQFWGQGYAAEACRRMLLLLFTGYGVSEASAQVDTRNAASIALLERLGFTQAGFQSQADFFKGHPSDEYTYLLLPSAHAMEAGQSPTAA